MGAKMYLKMFCNNVKAKVLISYNVEYQNLTPHLGENRCEYHGDFECVHCPMKQLRRNIVFDHFEDIYKKLPLFIVLENDSESETN